MGISMSYALQMRIAPMPRVARSSLSHHLNRILGEPARPSSRVDACATLCRRADRRAGGRGAGVAVPMAWRIEK